MPFTKKEYSTFLVVVGVSSVLYDVVGQLAYYIITHPNPNPKAITCY